MAGSSQDLGPSSSANTRVPTSASPERHRLSTESVHSYNQDEADDLTLADLEPMLPDTLPTLPFRGITRIKGPNTVCRIVFLTICLAGLQFTWTVEMAYGTPYLLSLGLTKSSMSLVWIAGPLSGLLMQPIVGVLSDRCTSRFGRRRPFLILGSIIVTLSLLVIGWTREITGVLVGSQEGDTFTKISIFIAISSIYILDFSINCVQASCRALLVDSLPPSLQEDGTAWAGRMVGLGNVVGYFMGYADLVAAFPFLGDTQLKVLCVIAAFVLLLCDAITCYAVSEKTLVKQPEKKSWKAPFKALGAITSSIWNLPKPIQRICNVQFFAWIGWFPFLFYSTTWVAEIYDQNALQKQPNDSSDAVGQATRAGSFAFLVYSIVSLGASFLLPLIVAPSYSQEPSKMASPTFKFTYKGVTYSITPSKYLKISFLTLPRAWTASHIIFCLSMLCTIFVSDVLGASVVIGICGISWSLTMWAPFSLLGEYISESEAKEQAQHNDYDEENPLGVHRVAMSSRVSLAAGGAGLGAEGGIYQLVEQQLEESREVDAQMEMQPYKDEGGAEHERRQSNEVTDDQRRTDVNLGPSAGVLLGIHNMYIVLPQFLVTFFSSIIFHLLEKDTPKDGEASSDAIGVVLRFGAIMAGIAAYLSTRIGRDL